MIPLRKAHAELVAHVLGGVRSPLREPLEHELASWLAQRSRFARLLSEDRDKVRKKLRAASDDASLLDVRAELLVAAQLCADRRFTLSFEAYGSGRGGPDFAVAFRERQRFDLEVTRPRQAAQRGVGDEPGRLARTVAAKLRQLTAGVPNVVVVVSGTGTSPETVAAALQRLKVLTGAGAGTPAMRGASARALYVRLAAVVALGEGPGVLCLAPDARHALPREVAVALSRCLGGAPV